jgi:antitoxin component HigA of HigAB toxin-antitoxin module
MRPITNADLWDILTQAESRVREYSGTEFDHVAKHAQETVDLVMARLERKGLTRVDLEGLAGIERMAVACAGV